MAYVESEHMHLEVVEPVDVGLNASDTVDMVASNVLAAIVTSQEVANAQAKLTENGVDLEKIGDILKFDDMDSNVDGTTNRHNEKLPESSERQIETGESSKNEGEVLEEEIVELEFEKVKPKLDTHSMHCPNCKAEVTKVILRRKVINYRPVVKQPVEPVKPVQEPKDLVGCFSCLSLFTFSDNGCFNPFDIFRKSPETATVSPPPGNSNENATLIVREKDNCLSMFWVFGKGQSDPKPEAGRQPDPVYDDREYISSDQVQPPRYVTGNASIAKGSLPSSSNTPRYFNKDTTLESTTNVNGGGVNKGLLGFSRTSSPDLPLPPSSNVEEDGEFTIEVDTEAEITGVVNATSKGRSLLGFEILKSIVYGGLMEVIASLSVVASAAASEATTLNIVALSFASLIGGILIIGHNLWDLKDDCKKESLTDEANKEAANKYKELLGRVNYFPLHAFFAILSFLVFGMVPPAAYGYSFNKTNDKDYTVVVVAVASLLCVTLLATFKAYINKCTVFEYFKTLVYYITTAVSVSGVSYVAGNLGTRLLEELGMFDTSSSGGVSFFPDHTLSLASF